MQNMLRRESGLYKSNRVAVLRLVPCYFKVTLGKREYHFKSGPTTRKWKNARLLPPNLEEA